MERRGDTPRPEEPQEPIRSIDFVKFGYDENDQLGSILQERLQRAGSSRVIEVATSVFGPDLAAYAAGAISEQELERGDQTIVTEFKQGTYSPVDENVMRLLIGLDIAQRLRDTQHSEENILVLFEKRTDTTGTVYERLHTTEDKNLAFLHRQLRDRVERISQKPQPPDKPTKRMQTQTRYGKQKRRG